VRQAQEIRRHRAALADQHMIRQHDEHHVYVVTGQETGFILSDSNDPPRGVSGAGTQNPPPLAQELEASLTRHL
jgi:hypothetical protein